MMPAVQRFALAEMARGGLLYVYIGNGELCQHPAKIGSGVIVGDHGRTPISRRTVRMLERHGIAWSNEDRAAVLPAHRRQVARMLADGRDVLEI